MELFLFFDGVLILILLIGLLSADRRARYWRRKADAWRALKIKQQDEANYPLLTTVTCYIISPDQDNIVNIQAVPPMSDKWRWN